MGCHAIEEIREGFLFCRLWGRYRTARNDDYAFAGILNLSLQLKNIFKWWEERKVSKFWLFVACGVFEEKKYIASDAVVRPISKKK